MERFGRRENVLLGYSPQRDFGNQSSSSKSNIRHSRDFDFQDVFGGPPRRYSMQEMGYSFRETTNSSSSNANKYGAEEEEEEDTELSPSSFSGFNERPVFGEERVNRRRYPSDDFFDDIFRGDESVSSRSDIRDSFGSSPGSRVLSPARPLPPRADPLESSLPAQFQYSLPAKLTNAMDFPSFASGNRNPYKNKDPISNGISCTYPPNSPLSGLSSDAFQEQDELRNETRPSYRPSPLSHEFSLSRKDSSCTTKSNELESLNIGSDLKKNSKSTEDAPGSSSHFHFSIYKWAGKGVPLLTPIRRVNSLKSKEKLKTERCSSSNGRIENDNLESGTQRAISCETDSHFLSHSESVSTNNESSITEGRMQDKSSLLKTSTEDKVETCRIVEEAVLSIPGSKFINNSPDIVETKPDDVFSVKREEIKPNSVTGMGLCESTEKEIATSRQEDQKPELKPLRSLLFDTQEGHGNDERIRKSEVKDHMVKKTEVSHSNDDESKKIKKRDEKINNSKRAEAIEVNEPFSQGSSKTSGDNLGKNGLKGKVKDFIKIFNQEATSKPKIDIETRSQSSRWKGTRTGTWGADNEGSAKTTQTNGEYHIHNTNKMKTPPNASILVDENLVESEKQQSFVKTTVFSVNENSLGQKDASELSSESVTDGSKVIVEDIDDLFHENFTIKELSNYQDNPPEIKEVHEDIQMSDAKIRQWKNGKEGNIRSMLSTLQYVLWPGSGWKPVPLVDIIEGSAVKRSYQKALLCLHPDKLQQKGVASHQKYIAAKVFDILQEAWEHFNSLGGM